MMDAIHCKTGQRPRISARFWSAPVLWRFGFTLLLAITTLTPAAPGADSVVVVYNRNLPESKGVAEHYAQRRSVPADQVVGLALPTYEAISRQEYNEQLREPLLQILREKKLLTWPAKGATNGLPSAAKIRYLALCYGVPLKIKHDSDLKEAGSEQLPPALRRTEAAVDSELACLPGSVTNYLLSGVLRNPFYGATNASLLHPTNGLLLVARLDGPSPAIARALVDKAMEAETNGLWGRAYFDIRNIQDTNYIMGDRWIATAAAMAWRMGYLTEMETNAATLMPGFPLSQVAIYAGWYDQHVSGPFARPQVEFMPGAFAYHLHSFSATTLRATNRNWVGPLLARGVTATIGFVEEPYLAGTLDLPVFIGSFLGRGFTLGEAAYAAQGNLSWMMTVVGDPLYRPAGRRPEDLHDDLLRRNSPLIEWSHAKVANLNLATGLPAREVIAYLEKEPTTAKSAVLTEMLADLYWHSKKLLDGLDYTELALKLNPSPQQKVRLLKQLADRLRALNRDEQRLACLAIFAQEFPDHPDLPEIRRQIAELESKLGRPVEKSGP